MEIPRETINEKTVEIFTSKDKDFMQLWHYDQVLKMDLSEAGRDTYFSVLNTYTYKMSKLGLVKYQYTDSERKLEFDKLVDKLDSNMKNILSLGNYIIHCESFNKIEQIIYKKRLGRIKFIFRKRVLGLSFRISFLLIHLINRKN